MITTSKKPGPQYFRKLMILPLAAILIGLFAFSYRNKTNNNSGPSVTKPITVVIDAGHGVDADGKHNGVRAENGMYEDDIVLSIAKKIKEQNTDENIRILLTRETEDRIELKRRVDYVNNQQADLFISLHCNAAPRVLGTTGNPLSGFEVYVSKKNATFYSENRILASTLLNYFAQIYPALKNIQARQPGVYVLDAANCPSALVECGYLTNKQDLAFVGDPANQDKIASSILQSIEMYGSLRNGDDWEERKKAIADTLPKKDQQGKNIQDTSLDASQKKAWIIEGGVVIKDKDNKRLYLPNARITIEGADKNGNKKPLSDDMLFIIDGKEQRTIKSFVGIEKMIDPSEIYSIDVLKNEAATSKYGEKGKNGVIIIKTKKTNSVNPQNITQTDNNKIFDKVEVPPAYTGGDLQWRQYLERELNAIPASRKAPPGAYSVVAQFVVGLDGKMSDVKALTNQGYGMEEEVLRAMNKSTLPWIPAMQNGHQVKAYKKQIVTFMIGDNAGTYKGSESSGQNEMNEVVITALSKNVSEGENIIFDKTEVPPSFPGGDPKWRQYLERNCNGQVANDNGAPEGTYTVDLKFIVDQQGFISDIKALTSIGYGMEKEAIRVISKGPRWVPAMQNGHEVKAYATQKLTFVVARD